MPIQPVVRGIASTCACAAAIALATACLDRPVGQATPTVTARFGEVTNQDRISKIDLLFMIDNSGSMADKQKLLADVIPDLVDRLVDPIFLNRDGSAPGLRAGAPGHCPPPTQPDFAPVRGIPIRIITSSPG